MAYSIYDLVRNGKYENCAILTYSLNIKFYESVIWMRLHQNGCFNNLMFVDGSQYNNALMQEKQTLDFLGTKYTICPIYTLAAFHPKIILLTSKNKGKLIIGSANITSSAFTFNREIVNEFEVEANKDETYLYLFKECWAYINRLASDAPPFIKRQIQQLRQTTLWLEKKAEPQDDAIFVSFPTPSSNDNKKVIDSLESSIGRAKIKSLTILSPFLDRDLGLLEYFTDKYGVKHTNFIIDPENPIDPAAQRILKTGVSLYKFTNPIAKSGATKLHAKVIYFQTDKYDFLLCGSMNFTSKGFGTSSTACNYEAGILYRIKNRNYFNELGLSEMMAKSNNLDFSDIKFERIKIPDVQDEAVIMIKWIEAVTGAIKLYLCSKLPEPVKSVAIWYYDKSDNLIKEEVPARFIAEDNSITVQGINRDIVNKSICAKIIVTFKSGMQRISLKSVINKTDQLNDVITKSNIAKIVRDLNGIVPTNQNYGILLELLHRCLFDAYDYSSSTDTTSIQGHGAESQQVLESAVKGGKLSYDDIVSTTPNKKALLSVGRHYDNAGDVVKDYFINTFLRGNKGKDDVENDVVRKKFELDRMVSKKIEDIEKEEKETKELVNGEEDESDEDVDELSEPFDAVAYSQHEANENLLLRRLVRRYKEHIGVLEADAGLVHLENEFVRHFAVFWMVLKGLERKYNIISIDETFSLNDFIWFNLFFASALINKRIGIILTTYISEKDYVHDEGFGFGVCSLLVGFCLTDSQLRKGIEERFQAYDKRRLDLLWIINRLLLLSFISRFDEKEISDLLDMIKKNYNSLRPYAKQILESIDFAFIKNMIEEAVEVLKSMKFCAALWLNGKRDTTKELQRGDLVFIRPYGIYTVKDVRLDDVYLYGGVDADKTFYQTTISIKKSNYLKLESTDIVKKYFKGLLDPRKSYWHVNAIDESIY